jgi:negative regulator of sigma E activity
MMRKNHSSLTAALAAGVLMLSAASSWANEAPQAAPQAQPVVGVAAPVVEAAPAPIRLAWDRVGITAYGFSA